MLTDSYPPSVGGTEYAVQGLAHALTLHGHRVTIVTPKLMPGTPQNDEVRVVRFSTMKAWGSKFLSQNVRGFRQVVEQHRSQPFDYLQSFHVSPFGITSVVLKKMLHLPLITSLMGADTYSPQSEMAPRDRWVTLPFLPWVMNSSNLVTAPSEDLARHALRQGCRKKITVIPHGVDPDRFDPSALQTSARLVRERLGIRNDGFMLLTVHRLDKRKDLSTAIQALRNVLRHKPNVKLVVVGAGPERGRFLELAKREGVAPSIVFVGYVSDQQLPSYYAATDLFLLSSFYEAFGLVLLQAMAAGKCVVASNVGGVPEIVRDGVTGFLFPVGNVDVLTSILLDVLEDEEHRLKMGEAGRKRVLEGYTWAEISKQYLNAFINR